jgi:hypothetical protein
MTGRRKRLVERTIGRTLADLGSRVNVWRQQRDHIAAEIRQVLDTANQMLADLGPSTQIRPSRRASGNIAGNGRKRRRMSAAARAKISAAQKARWAKLKKKT